MRYEIASSSKYEILTGDLVVCTHKDGTQKIYISVNNSLINIETGAHYSKIYNSKKSIELLEEDGYKVKVIERGKFELDVKINIK